MAAPILRFQANWHTHLQALAAICRKDWIHYWRYPLNAVSDVLHPIVWLTPMYFMGKTFSVNGEALGFAGYSGTSDYMSFVLLGATLGSFVGAVFWGMGYSLKQDMDAGVLEANWLTPIPRPLLLVGRTFTSLLITSITSLSMLIIAALLFGFRPTGNVVAALLTILPMLIGLYGFGFAFASLVLVVREANMMVDVSNFLVSTFSGEQFPVTVLPRWLLPISFSLPLTYGYDAVRGWLLHTPTLLPMQVEIALLLVFMVGMIFLGLLAFRLLERRVRMLGSLGQH